MSVNARVAGRRLGGQGLVTSAVGLGCVAMTGLYGPVDVTEARATIRRALELGVDHFDTADAYGDGDNERLLARALAGHREGLVLASKCGRVVRDGRPALDGSPAHIRAACEASLARLRTDRIDLYYLHRVDPRVPIEESMGALAELVREGKIRFVGLSEAGLDTIRRAHAVHPLSAVQNEYSLWCREPEDGLLALCRELDIGLVAYSPLGRGFLSGAVRSTSDLANDDVRHRFPRFRKGALERNVALVDRLETVARGLGLRTAQVALAWVLAQGDDVTLLTGTTRRAHLDENVRAAELVLDRATLAEIERSVPREAVAGERHPDPTSLGR